MKSNQIKNFIKTNFMAIIIFVMVIIGNVWCYLENGRMLTIPTNIIGAGVIVFYYIYKTPNHLK